MTATLVHAATLAGRDGRIDAGRRVGRACFHRMFDRLAVSTTIGAARGRFDGARWQSDSAEGRAFGISLDHRDALRVVANEAGIGTAPCGLAGTVRIEMTTSSALAGAKHLVDAGTFALGFRAGG